MIIAYRGPMMLPVPHAPAGDATPTGLTPRPPIVVPPSRGRLPGWGYQCAHCGDFAPSLAALGAHITTHHVPARGGEAA